MSKRLIDDECDKEFQRQRLNDNEVNMIADVVAQNQESLPAIFKLNAICCDDLFEWLSIKDLRALGQTCKRMYRLIGIYTKDYFNVIHRKYTKYILMNGFGKFARGICLTDANKIDFQMIGENFDSLQHISLYWCHLTKECVDYIKVKLSKIEKIYVSEHIDEPAVKFYDDFLKYCPNLKALCLELFHSNDDGWMFHKYPKLECFSLINSNPNLYKNLGLFFQNHTQIISLEMDSKFFLENSDTIINSKLKLSVLKITFDYSDVMDSVCTSLNKLYDDGFYKRLEARFWDRKNEKTSKIIKLRGIERLSVYYVENTVLPVNVKLKYLQAFNRLSNIDIDNMIIAFPNLQQLDISDIYSMDQLIPIVRQLPKLKIIILVGYRTLDFNPVYAPMDLVKLNEERKKLLGACKVTIYVKEAIYLLTKMAPKNLYGKHDLIELKTREMGLYTFQKFSDKYL